MLCQHCGGVFEDLDALQTHHVTSCPAIASDDDSILVPPNEPEKVEVEFKWLEDRIVSDETKLIHLIISTLDYNIELNKNNGGFKAEGVEINTGAYIGQLVIGNDILPLSEFIINQHSETVFLIIDRDSSQLTLTEEGNLSTNLRPVESEEDELPENSPRRAGFHAMDQPLGIQSEQSGMGNLLSEESFGGTGNQQTEHNMSPKFDNDQHYTFTPDDPTLQNIETLDLDLSPRREQLPSEHQQPFENDIRDREASAAFEQLSGNSSPEEPHDDNGIGPPNQQQNNANVEQILHELSMTDQEEDRGNPLHEYRSLPQAPTHQQNGNAFTPFLNKQQEQPLNEPDIRPSRLKTRSSDLTGRYEDSPTDHMRRSSDDSPRNENYHHRSRPSSGFKPADERSPRDQEDPEKVALREELKRLQDLTENYKEVKAELEVKCQSYDEEIERLKKMNEEFEETRKKECDGVKEMKSECDAKCQSYESEINRLKEKCNDVIETLQSRTDKEEELVNGVRAEYEMKCQSYGNEIQRLKEKCNQLVETLQKKTDGHQGVLQRAETNGSEDPEELHAKILSYEHEIERLTSKCSELEELRKMTSIMTQKDERVKNIQRVNELEAKCASYDDEMNRLKQHCLELEQQGRQNALHAARRRPSDDDNDDDELNNILKTTELQAKCDSYDTELKRLQKACRELRIHVKSEQELRKASEEEKQALEIRVTVLNEEMQKLSIKHYHKRSELSPQYAEGLIEKHREENLMSQQIISELEAKCQSYDLETEHLKRENGKYKDKYLKAKEYLKTLVAQQSRFEGESRATKEENQRLKGENESLEMVRKLREKDVEVEKKTFETSLGDLKKENDRLKNKLHDLSTSTFSSSDYNIRDKIAKLQQGNEKLRRNLAPGYSTTALQREDSDDDLENNYEPKIISPRHQSSSLASSSAKYNKKTFANLPDKHKRIGDEYEDRNRSYESGSRSYDYRPYASKQIDTSQYDKRANERHNHRYSQENGYLSHPTRSSIEDIMKRYSNGHDSLSPRDRSKDSPPPHHRRRGSLTDNIDNIGRHFSSGTMESRLPPKARSYDHVDRLLDNTPPFDSPRSINSPTIDKATLIPFSPTQSNELKVGMKVCVTRSNGRMSRGIVKWIGPLPSNYGDFVGVELETESGKHDGVFENVRYFRSKPNRGVFVKFSKVIMGWK